MIAARHGIAMGEAALRERDQRARDTAAAIWALWPGARPVHVIDVGANPVEGEPSYKPLMERGFARVTGFEPQPAALDALMAQKSSAETYLPYALGAGDAGVLRLFRESGFASLFPMNRAVAALFGWGRAARQTGSLAVATRRMDDIAELDPADFLKIDVQGSELSVIANGAAKLAEAVAVQTEVRFVPLYEGEPAFGDLDAELRRQGFLFHDFAFLKRVPLRTPSQRPLRPRAFRQVVDGDAFYIRDLSRPGLLSDTQLFRLALLADAVLKSPNVALWCLDLLVARGRVPAEGVAGYLALLPSSWRR